MARVLLFSGQKSLKRCAGYTWKYPTQLRVMLGGPHMRHYMSYFGTTTLVARLRLRKTAKFLLVTALLVFTPALFADSGLVSDKGTALVRWIEIEPGEQPHAYRNFDECVIYAPDPRWMAWTGSLGHEIAHCFAGAYHPQAGHVEDWGPWNQKRGKRKKGMNAG